MVDSRRLEIAVLGPTNAGKSTLFNAILGKDISIVTHKVQTTRFPIRGILTLDHVQLTFIDSPGMFSPKGAVERIVHHNYQSVCCQKWDYVLFVLDVTKCKCFDENIFHCLNTQLNGNLVLVLNKIDLILRSKLLEITANLQAQADFKAVFMISALKNDGVSDLLKFLVSNCKENQTNEPQPQQIDPDAPITDAPVEYIAAEITRKQLFLNIHEEIPYSLFVCTERVHQNKQCIFFFQTIYVTKTSHKAIILGKHGSNIERIRYHAEKEISKLLQLKTKLVIFIKVKSKWTEDARVIKSLGY